MKTRYSVFRSMSAYALILILLTAPAVTVRGSKAQPTFADAGKTFSKASLNAPGDLDLTFSGDGKLTETIPFYSALTGRQDEANAVAMQPDGKIIVAGYSRRVGIYERADFMVARYNAGGTLDSSFGFVGMVLTDIDSGYDVARSVAIQTDGKIVVAGSTAIGANSGDIVLVRYNPDGSLDTSFDSDGIVRTSGYGEANCVAIQPDGKIIVAGTVVARYNPDGSLDTTFDGDGIAMPPIQGRASGIALQPDGRIVTAGSWNDDFAIIRYNPNGSPDTSFDGDGIATTSIAGADAAYAVAIQPDGKIVAAGGSDNDFALARYNSSGSLDASFDGDGKVRTPVGPDIDIAHSVAVGSDGKIVAAGSSYIPGTGYDFAMVRYNSNGSLDGSFDVDGRVTTPVGLYVDYASAVAIQTDGKIVAVGNIQAQGPAPLDIAVVRYDPNGSKDPTFGGNGIVVTDAVVPVFTAGDFRRVAVQPDGKIIAAGTYLARYNDDGSFDNTFGINGKVTDFAAAVAIQTDGKIVTAGTSLARYNENGSIDTTFGTNGKVAVPSYAVAIQPDGKIVALGSECVEFDPEGDCTSSVAELVRLNTNGSLDVTFDGDGKVAALVAALAIQPDGKIVTVRSDCVDYDPDWECNSSVFEVARLNPDGSPDITFDGDGKTTTPVSSYSSASAIRIQSDGKIVVAGSETDGFALVRYNTDGSLDTSFDGDGKVLTPVSSGSLASVVIQFDGKIVALVSSSDAESGADFAIVRYNPDGSLDATFGGGDGKTAVDFNISSDHAYGMVLDRRGRAVLAGASNESFALARLVLGPGAVETHIPFDFDGDGRSDVSVFRPSDNNWYLNRSQLGFAAYQFGASGDILTPADFTGDGKTDIAVFRPSVGNWFVLRSEDNTYYANGLGANGDIPAPADYDGDGKADIAVYRPSQGTWYLQRSTAGSSEIKFGLAEDKPAVGDFDGDGKADISVFRPSTSFWYRLNSLNGQFVAAQFGAAGDRIVPSDYTGDGKTDIAVWRPTTGTWYVLKSEDLTFYGSQFGLASDLPTPGDYDGDGKSDLAVFRPSDGNWYLQQSTSGFTAQHFGSTGDKPTPGAFVY